MPDRQYTCCKHDGPTMHLLIDVYSQSPGQDLTGAWHVLLVLLVLV